MSDFITDSTEGTEAAAAVDDRRRLLVVVAAGLLAIVAVAVPVIVILVSRTSSASFADAEVLSANRLGAATLDIDVAATPGGPGESGGGGSGVGARVAGEALFSATNLAPGDVVSGQLEMTNAGTVPLRYGLLAFSDGGVLEEWLRFEVWAGTGTCSPNQPGARVIEDVRVGLASVPLVEIARSDGVNVLEPGESFLWCIGATLSLDTPNEAQGAKLDVTLTVPAEQVVEEQP